MGPFHCVEIYGGDKKLKAKKKEKPEEEFEKEIESDVSESCEAEEQWKSASELQEKKKRRIRRKIMKRKEWHLKTRWSLEDREQRWLVNDRLRSTLRQKDHQEFFIDEC